MKNLKHIVSALLPTGPMDAVGVGVIDFEAGTYQAFDANFEAEEVHLNDNPDIWFDLASVTKPLTNSLAYFLAPSHFTPEMLLCLNHRGGLPAWGLLPENGWREQLLSYPIRESETLYSDFSALRVMLALEEKGVDEKELCRSIWDPELTFWTDLPEGAFVVQTGYKMNRPNFGYVHDPNAWTIQSFCGHAGLFATTGGLCRTLLSYEAKTGFIAKVRKDLQNHNHRFSFGWDRVINPQETLAGKGCGAYTFGHLGFTGTSVWIDPDRRRGHVILSNAVKFSWYDKANLNDLRRALGEAIWKDFL